MFKKIILSFVFVLPFLTGAFAGEAQDSIAKANAFVAEKKYEEAAAEYDRALKAEPKNVKAMLLAGLAHAQLGEWNQAVSYTKKASDLDPSYSSFYHLGMIYAATGDAAKALEAFDRALALSPNSFMAEYQKGLVLAGQGEHGRAIESYEKALKLNPYLENARVGLAGSYLKLDNREAALGQVEELRRMKQPTLAQALENRINGKTP